MTKEIETDRSTRMRSKSLSRCATLLFASFFAVLIFLAGSGAQAQVASKADRASAESLTQSLIALHTQYRATPAEGRAALIGQLRALAAERQQFLNSLIQTSPAEVLRVAIPSEVSAHMPGSVRGYLEQETDTEGELQVTYEDAKNSATLHHYVKTGGQRLELKFAANAPTNLLTGARVHVHGTRIGSALALSSGTSTSSFQVVQAAPLANTFGAQSTLVMLVNFQDNPVQPYTVASVQDAVFNQTSGFWMENSFQQTWLTGDVAGWYTLSLSSTSCNVDTIASYAEQAAQNSGYALSNYNHFLIAFPSTTACVWWGYSYIGGTPSTSWVNGVVQIKVVSHELGHALGLYHSHSLDCGTVVYAASGCTLNEYGDSFDTMGNSSPMDYDA